MDKKMFTDRISGSDIARFFMPFNSGEEAFASLVEASMEFVNDCKTLTESMSSLLKNDKVRLTLAGVEVTVEVKGLGKQLMYAKLGSTGSAEELHKIMEDKIDELEERN